MKEQPCVQVEQGGSGTPHKTVQPILEADTPNTYTDLISKKVTELSKEKSAWFKYDKWILGGMAVTSGLVINHQLKRALLVYEGVVSSMAASGYCAFLAAFGYNALLIKYPLYSGKLDCSVCATTRGGVFQAIASTIAPLVASVCVNTIVGDRYRAPEVDAVTKAKGLNVLRYWYKKIRPMSRRLWIAAALNAIVGASVAYKQEAIVSEVHRSVTEEEINEILSLNWDRRRGIR